MMCVYALYVLSVLELAWKKVSANKIIIKTNNYPSCFAANMAVKQNAIELVSKYPLASAAVFKSFYVDDGLTRHKKYSMFTAWSTILQKTGVCAALVIHHRYV